MSVSAVIWPLWLITVYWSFHFMSNFYSYTRFLLPFVYISRTDARCAGRTPGIGMWDSARALELWKASFFNFSFFFVSSMSLYTLWTPFVEGTRHARARSRFARHHILHILHTHYTHIPLLLEFLGLGIWCCEIAKPIKYPDPRV